MTSAATLRLLRAIPYGVHALGLRVGDARHALVVSWVTQLSTEPLLVGVALQRHGHAATLLGGRGTEEAVFALAPLRADARAVATRLGRPHDAPGADVLSQLEWRPGDTLGAPALSGALGWLEGRVARLVDVGGDHLLLVGEVVAARLDDAADGGTPLRLADTRWRYGN